MLYAIVEGEKTLAQKNTQGKCPECETKVIPKCGPIKINHWAHKTVVDCVYEGETEWHREWKSVFPKEWVEQKINGLRADVAIPNGPILEFQSKSLPVDEIEKREKNYKNVVWILNSQHSRIDFNKKEYGFTFRWKWPNTRWSFASCPLVFDAQLPENFERWNGMIFFRPKIDCFVVKKIYFNGVCRGWGKEISRESFINCLKNGRDIKNL